jgi:hypothetical protein
MTRSPFVPLATALLALALPPARANEQPPASTTGPENPAKPANTKTAPRKGPLAPAKTAATREQARKKMLERFDADGDGTLSADERQAAKAESEARMLERFDADGDGSLSEPERAAARGPHKKQAEKSPAATDPARPARPAKPARPADPARGQLAERLLKKFDIDGDGKLSPAERAAVKAARQKRAQPKKD